MQRKCFIKMFISFTILSKLVYIVKKNRESHLKVDPSAFFIGKWHISDPNTHTGISIQIGENREIYLNKQLMNGQLISIENDKLVFRDHFGYELVVTKLSSTTLNLFDEADEKNYYLVRET
jgi:hypothetical protein